jgi:hypothetical protein
MKRAHVVEAIRELHQEHADVARHREQHLAEALRLAVLARAEVDLAELGHALDEEGNLLAELLGELHARRRRVLDHVVQQRGADAGGVEVELGDDAGDADRMDEIGVPRATQLTLVHTGGVHVRPIDQLGVRVLVIAPDSVENLRERDHLISHNSLHRI